MDKPDIVFKHFTDLTPKQKRQFRQLGPLYSDWNSKINVISRNDINQLYEKHVLHSLAIARLIPFRPGNTVLDVGTGGGFPGIPLAIYYPKTRFHLIDSTGKKVKVVREIINSLELMNASAEPVRIENHKEKYNFVIVRAVAHIKQLTRWSGKNIKAPAEGETHNGLIALKGGDLTEELKSIKKLHQVAEISEFFEEPFFSSKKIIYIPLP